MSTADLRPAPACPKCANPTGFAFCAPKYKCDYDFAERPEWLEWECGSCGYVIETPTADAA